MDSFEWNKVFAAILAAAFVVMGLTFLSDGIFHADNPEKPGFAIAGAEVKTATDTKKEDSVEPVATLLASADLGAGQKAAKKCAACHTFEKGGKIKQGPNLYGIVDRAIGGVDGYKYSAPLVAYGEGKVWNYDELNKFLYKPKALIKGTSMGYAGVKKTPERAALIAYLRSLADTPSPLPSE